MTKISVYLHSDKGNMREHGFEAGLNPNQIEEFAYALYEVELDLEVDDTGKTLITAVNGSPLVTPVTA